MHPSSFTTLLLWGPDFEGVSGNEFPFSFLRLGPRRPLPPIVVGGRDGCGPFISRAEPPARCEGFLPPDRENGMRCPPLKKYVDRRLASGAHKASSF